MSDPLNPTWRDGTRVVHAGLPPKANGTPYLPGPTFAEVSPRGGTASPRKG